MDKVLVHRSFSTLDVIAIAFVTVTVFDVVLGGLRTYIFSHTTSRIDVELVPSYLGICWPCLLVTLKHAVWVKPGARAS